MPSGTVNVPVCYRVGWLGLSAIAAARLLSRAGLRLPLSVLVWAVVLSSYVRIGNGPWRKLRLGLRAEDF